MDRGRVVDGGGGDVRRQLNLAQQARVATGLSQRRFAKLLGVAPSLISKWETGSPPSGPALALLRVIRDYPAAVIETLNPHNTKG